MIKNSAIPIFRNKLFQFEFDKNTKALRAVSVRRAFVLFKIPIPSSLGTRGAKDFVCEVYRAEVGV